MNVSTASRPRRVPRRFIALFMVMAFALAACGGGGNGDDAAAPDGDADPADKGTITIGLIPWDEAIAVTNLWQILLEEEGYEVEQVQLEVGGLYSGVANGDLDLFLDAWLPATHADYWEEFGDDIEELATWYEEAPLTWVVPAYVDDVNSIADLQGKADTFNGQIVGIEAGSGLMRISREDVVPTYGLDDYELVEGSTPAMLATLEKAIKNEDPVVVTLWEPHWAYGAWDLKNLEDPEGALGEPDQIKAIGSQQFVEDFPQVADWMRNFSLSIEPLASLEVAINEGGEGKELESTRAWLEDNRDVVEGWIN